MLIFIMKILSHLAAVTIVILFISLNKCIGMENCEAIIQHHEALHGIPAGLLKAISRIESGRYIPGQGMVTWPWTINANGSAYYLDSKEKAIEKARELQKSGITSMDVGPMQINLKHHPDAFDSLEEAFDPWKNVAYAARFLLQKKDAQGSWQEAVAHYHSATATFNIPYREKVMESWAKNGGASPTQTLFNMNMPTASRSALRSTLYSRPDNRKIPLYVRFARKTKNGQIRSRGSTQASLYQHHNPKSIINRPQIAQPTSLVKKTPPNGLPKNQSTLYGKPKAQ